MDTTEMRTIVTSIFAPVISRYIVNFIIAVFEIAITNKLINKYCSRNTGIGLDRIKDKKIFLSIESLLIAYEAYFYFRCKGFFFVLFDYS